MIVLIKIITLILGFTFSLFGYLIYFKEKSSLINGFENDYKSGFKTKKYAKTVGIIEFIIGISLVVFGVVFIVFL